MDEGHKLTRSDCEAMKVVDLRQALQERGIRGNWIRSALKEDLIDAITGEAEAEQIAKRVYARQINGESVLPGDAEESEDVDVSDSDLDTVLTALRSLSPRTVDQIESMRDELAELRKRRPTRRTFAFQPSDDEIGLRLGEDRTVVLKRMLDSSAPDNLREAVPTLEEGYRLDLWSAGEMMAGTMVRFDAIDLANMLVRDYRILLVGPPAAGKTSVIRELCGLLNWPMSRYNGNRDVTVDDFVGCWEARGGQTLWTPGVLPRAMREGHVLVLDEVDHIPAECSSILHSVMEPGGRLVISANGGEVVDPHPNFRIVATSNTTGYGDETGLHPNAQVQDAAFLSRFDAVFRIGFLDPEDEVDILVGRTGLDEEVATKIVAVATDSRNAVGNGDMLSPITLRHTLAWGSMMSDLDGETSQVAAMAFACAVLSKLPASDRKPIMEIAQRHLGNDLLGA